MELEGQVLEDGVMDFLGDFLGVGGGAQFFLDRPLNGVVDKSVHAAVLELADGEVFKDFPVHLGSVGNNAHGAPFSTRNQL